MATLRGAVKALLEGDATLMTTLTGGMYDRREISRTLTPDAYDTDGTLKPCGLVSIEATTPHGPKQFDFERTFFVVYLYEEEGGAYASIDVAKDRIRALLHRQTVSIDTGAVFEILHSGSLGDSHDEALRAEMTFERFYAWRNRT